MGKWSLGWKCAWLTAVVTVSGLAAEAEQRRSQRQGRIRGMTAGARPENAPLKRREATKPDRSAAWEGLLQDRVVVKFKDGATVRQVTRPATVTPVPLPGGDRDRPRRRARGEEGASEGTAVLSFSADRLSVKERTDLTRHRLLPARVAQDVARVNAILAEPRIRGWEPLFSATGSDLASRRRAGEERSGIRLADLGNYYQLFVTKGTDARALADELNALPSVEIAYLPPRPQDADIPPTTPAFDASQGYLGPAPTGIDARYAWTVAGGRGEGIKVIDLEAGWNLNHEDLPSMFVVNGVIDTDVSRQHGTAVLGEIVGLDDGSGVVGIASNASAGVISVLRPRSFLFSYRAWNVAEALWLAGAYLDEGDVVLIEQHARGPGNDQGCTCNCGQWRYVAMEYWQAEFDAIQSLSARGILVVEAAGNGGQNLDAARYDGAFNLSVRNSGAIVVGAGNSLSPTCWTNFGSRVDVQGWGNNVVTTGYGDLAQVNGPNDDNQWYTNTFSGTSSASPIVTGAVAVLQGVQKANGNPVLSSAGMINLLRNTGTQQPIATTSQLIGPLPDLRRAIGQLSPASPIFRTDYLQNPSADSGAVSGVAGSSARVGQNDTTYAVERLQFGERGDRPCFLKVESGHVGGPGSGPVQVDTLDLCGGSGPTNRSLQYVPLLTTSHDTFVHGVQVCTSRTRNANRLKGVRVFQTKIHPDGTLERLSGFRELDRTNCNGDWHPSTLCPTGWLASEVVVHSETVNGNRSFTGLGLRCKRYDPVSTCVQNCP
ncbi:MAG: S8 family serine peptidase [Acidobacteria bacterium]|nr:S8 family serine peptidase [Acidobacteriota bacterium]